MSDLLSWYCAVRLTSAMLVLGAALLRSPPRQFALPPARLLQSTPSASNLLTPRPPPPPTPLPNRAPVPVLAGRTAVQCYSDLISSFASDHAPLMGTFITDARIGLGPAGELRYPSHPSNDGRWTFPGVGEYQVGGAYIRFNALQAACHFACLSEQWVLGSARWACRVAGWWRGCAEWRAAV